MKIAVDFFRTMDNRKYMELLEAIRKASALVKIMMGPCNNAAWTVCLQAHDKAKTLPQYRHEVKRAFRQSLDAWAAYERELLHDQRNRFFCLKDMSEKTRKTYGNITDREYYEFWTGTGCEMYVRTAPLITALQHKCKRILDSRGIANADALAWITTARACLDLAVVIYDMTALVLTNEHGIHARYVREVFGKFSLQNVRDRWKHAEHLLSLDDIPLTDAEIHNVELTLEQIQEAWTSLDLIYELMGYTAESYDEVFRTKGEMKKVLRSISELRQDFEKDAAKDRDAAILQRLKEKTNKEL